MTTTETTLAPPAPVSAPAVPTPLEMEALTQECREVLAEMLRLLAFEATLAPLVDNGHIRIGIHCGDAARLIGRRGSTINEIQFLINRILQRRHKLMPRIFLDVAHPEQEASAEKVTDNKSEKIVERVMEKRAEPTPEKVREKRAEAIVEKMVDKATEGEVTWRGMNARVQEKVTEKTAENEADQPLREMGARVRRWGESVELGPMDAAERKALQDFFARDREVEAVPASEGCDSKGMQPMRLQIRAARPTHF